MANPVLADTHAIVWYMAGSAKLSGTAFTAIDEAVRGATPGYVSAISLIELTYLVERERLPRAAVDELVALLEDPASPLTVVPVDLRVAEAVGDVARDAVPEMPDRIIVATAAALNVPLVTCDGKIRASGAQVIW
jgi:PIN domain nuclease of toxin-antitoxin system